MSVSSPGDSRPPVWVQTFPLRHSEVDRRGVIKLRTIFDLAQEAAANHASAIGVGMRYLGEQGRAWMLSRVRFAFSGALPRIGDDAVVETYPRGVAGRLFAAREFRLKDRSGTLFAAGTSWWILVDLNRLRPLALPESLPCPLPDNSARSRQYAELEKFLPPEGAPFRTFTVPESGIDVNCHLNNAEYAALVHDFLARLGRTADDLAGLQLDFIAGALTGDTLELVGQTDDAGFRFGGTRGGKAVFAARGWWK